MLQIDLEFINDYDYYYYDEYHLHTILMRPTSFALLSCICLTIVGELNNSCSALLLMASSETLLSTSFKSIQRGRRRDLPDKLLVSYTTQCSGKVSQAVRNGVNVVIWAFVEMIVVNYNVGEQQETCRSDQLPENDTKRRIKNNNGSSAKCIVRFDRDFAKKMIAQLDSEGYNDTIHLVSFGGWNGPHLPDELSAEEMYNAWKEECGDIFHGIDWDLEGHDDLKSQANLFSIQCLDNVGRISQLAKHDGYIIGMAPPQSYLDIQTPKFSRYVNLTETDRKWHSEFHYFGANVYAYLLSKYESSIDFVSVQFYESFSRAGMNIYHYNKSQAAYLQSYVQDLVMNKGETFFVDFDQDNDLNYSSREVQFSLSKLVLGFANGWGANDEDKVCYFDPHEIEKAYRQLHTSKIAPRGFMYWVM